MQVKDMTVAELKRLIRDQVEEVLEELLGDPDEGKEIKEEVKQQLIPDAPAKKSRNARYSGGRRTLRGQLSGRGCRQNRSLHVALGE